MLFTEHVIDFIILGEVDNIYELHIHVHVCCVNHSEVCIQTLGFEIRRL